MKPLLLVFIGLFIGQSIRLYYTQQEVEEAHQRYFDCTVAGEAVVNRMQQYIDRLKMDNDSLIKDLAMERMSRKATPIFPKENSKWVPEPQF